MEIWKDIQGYEGLYQVSNEGRVKSLRKNKILKTWKQNKYYQVVSLGANCKRLVHILVAKAFIPIWKSTMDVKRNLGYDNGNISRCCNGKIKTYKGYIWIYI